jgi:molybdopterin-guanine dinucleotide biosynthesis protein A
VRSDQAVANGIPTIIDEFEVATPLNGLLSAFQKHPSVAWLTVPVDMPGIGAAAIAHLLAHRDPTRVATCYFDSEGTRPEPLFAVWEPACAHLLPAFYASGGRSPRTFLMEQPVAMLRAPDANLLYNINTPEALAAWRKKQRP